MNKLFIILVISISINCKSNSEHNKDGLNKVPVPNSSLESKDKVQSCQVNKDEIIIFVGNNKETSMFTGVKENILLKKSNDNLECVKNFGDWKILNVKDQLTLLTKGSLIKIFKGNKELWNKKVERDVENGRIIDENSIVISIQEESSLILLTKTRDDKILMAEGNILDVNKDYIIYASSINDFSDIDVYRLRLIDLKKEVVIKHANIEMIYSYDNARKILYKQGDSCFIKDVITGKLVSSEVDFFKDGFYPFYNEMKLKEYRPDKQIFR